MRSATKQKTWLYMSCLSVLSLSLPLFMSNAFAASGPCKQTATLFGVPKTLVTYDKTLTISWVTTCTPSTTDWIGLYRADETPGRPGILSTWWKYTNGALSGTFDINTIGDPAGNPTNLIAPGAAGGYVFYYFTNNGYSRLASTAFAITSPTVSTPCLEPGVTNTNVKNVVIVIQENHSFDSYFGHYCTAPPGSNPICTTGPSCCEAGPPTVSGLPPLLLDDLQNGIFDPNHSMVCEVGEINGGLMDRYVTGIAGCSNRNNFAYSHVPTIHTYWTYASEYSLADRYFQPAAGASSENDVYFARAGWAFQDNRYVPDTAGSVCYNPAIRVTFTDTTLGDLLSSCSVPWAFYAEGFQSVLNNPDFCSPYPNNYDPSDNPFQYYEPFKDNLTYQRDYASFSTDISNGTLPAVSFIKALGIKTEHPGGGIKITDGETFVTEIVNAVLNSPSYENTTLILVVPDESGGFYDHIAPPATNTVDFKPYGARVPFLAIGYFAKPNYVSHVTMEHSSIVRWIEKNFLGGDPGQLQTRDAVVNDIESLLDPVKLNGPP